MMKKLILITTLILTINVEAQTMNWKYTCEEMPPEHENVAIWYSLKPNLTPDRWDKAFWGGDGNFYLTDQDRIIPAAQVSNWYIPTPPISYCSGGDGGDGGPLE